MATCTKSVKSAAGFAPCAGEATAVSVADGHYSYRCAEHYARHLASEWAELVYFEPLT